MRRLWKRFGLIVLIILCLRPEFASAALVTTHYPSDITLLNVSGEAEGRIGDLGGAALYELDVGNTSAPVQTAQFAWINGAPQPFTLTYDNILGQFSFTVGGNTLTYTPAILPRISSDIYIRTYAKTSSGTINSSILVDNLTLNGTPLLANSSTAFTSVPYHYGVDVLEISGEALMNGFTLTGNSTMTWTGNPPSQSLLSFQIRVADGRTDLSVAKTSSPEPVVVGQNLTYTITAMNNGPGTATGVFMKDTLPSGVTFVSATPSQGSCILVSNMVKCPLGTLANGASATITVVVSPTLVGTIINTATISGNQKDTNTVNNTTTLTSTVVSSETDLVITKTALPDPVIVGDTLTYTIAVTNNGPGSATGVTMTDTLPGGVTFGSASATLGSCSEASGIVTCLIGSLDSGATATMIIMVTPNVTGLISNTANVSGNEFDPNTANNSVSKGTTVDPPVPVTADLSVTKTDNPDPVIQIGDSLTYTIIVTNNGPGPATGVTVTDTLPVEVDYVSHTTTQGTCSGTATIICDLGILANGSSATISIIVTTNPPEGSISNTVSVRGDQADPDTANNSATENTNVGDLSRLLAISARAYVDTGDNREIAGFIIGGSLPKMLIIRGRGPSMSGAPFNITGTLSNPYIRLYSQDAGVYIAQNDNWGDQSDPLCASSGYVCGTPAEITATGMDPCMPNYGETSAPPGCANESSILITLPPGTYTAVLSGVNNGKGVGLVEVYDTDGYTLPKITAISTRAQVLTGFNRMIGGFTIGAGNGTKKILIKARGPSMGGAPFNISGTLSNPYVRLYSATAGAYIAQNDDWGDQSDPLCASSGYVCGTPAEITATGMDPCMPNHRETSAPPGCANESAILITVPPGSYTAVVSGVNEGIGVGLVEIYELP